MQIYNYIRAAKKAYDQENYQQAIDHLKAVDSDESCTLEEKLRASKLRGGLYVKLITLAQTDMERARARGNFQEEEMLQIYYKTLIEGNYTVYEPSSKAASEPEPVAKKSPKKKKPSQTEKLFKNAENLFQEDQIDEALVEFEKIVQMNNGHWPSYLHCINIYFDQQKFDKLKPLCEKIIAKAPSETPEDKEILYLANYYLAIYHIQKNEHHEALLLLVTAEEHKPGTVEIMLAYGNIAQKELLEPKKHYTLKPYHMAVNNIPSNSEFHHVMVEKGLLCFESALIISPDNTSAIQGLAAIHYYLGHWDIAKQYYEKLAKVNAEYTPTTLCADAQIAMESKEYDQVIQKLHAILDNKCLHFVDAARSDMHFTCGIAHEKQGRFLEAMREFNQALSIDIRNVCALFAKERLSKLNLIPSEQQFTIDNKQAYGALPILEMMVNQTAISSTSRAYLIGLCGQVYGKSRQFEVALNCYKLAQEMPLSMPEQSMMTQLEKLRELEKTNLKSHSIFKKVESDSSSEDKTSIESTPTKELTLG